MILRPVDENGDILPVLSSADLIRGAPATARLVKDRLELLSGDWWENLTWGNGIINMLQESRLTEADTQALVSYLSSYIRETTGVLDVRDAVGSVNGKQFQPVLYQPGHSQHIPEQRSRSQHRQDIAVFIHWP